MMIIFIYEYVILKYRWIEVGRLYRVQYRLRGTVAHTPVWHINKRMLSSRMSYDMVSRVYEYMIYSYCRMSMHTWYWVGSIILRAYHMTPLTFNLTAAADYFGIQYMKHETMTTMYDIAQYGLVHTRDMRKTCLNTNRWAVIKRFAIALTVFAVDIQFQIGPASVGNCKRAGPPNTGILFLSNEVLKNIIFKKRIA